MSLFLESLSQCLNFTLSSNRECSFLYYDHINPRQVIVQGGKNEYGIQWGDEYGVKGPARNILSYLPNKVSIGFFHTHSQGYNGFGLQDIFQLERIIDNARQSQLREAILGLPHERILKVLNFVELRNYYHKNIDFRDDLDRLLKEGENFYNNNIGFLEYFPIQKTIQQIL